MSSLGSTPRLRTNTRMLIEKAYQEDQRKRQKIMNSPRGHSTSKTYPSPVTNHGINSHNSSSHNGIIYRNNVDMDAGRSSHLEPILSDDLTPVDSINSPYSLTPSSMATSVSEYDTLFEDINEIVEKESHVNNSYLSEKFDKTPKPKPPSKAPLKTSSSCPTMRSNTRLTLPSKLDPSDFPDIDTYKKEKHNIVEKKRRYKINDCIQELADLLPQTYDVDLNMKKGYILEKSVEYINELKRESEKKREAEGRMKELERENRQLQLELQAMRRSQQASIRQQQQQQFLLLSPSYQQQQHRPSPNSNPIILNIGDQILSNNNMPQQRHAFNNNHGHSHFRNNPAPFVSDFPPPTDGELMMVDADSLMSNLQVSSELNDLDRQELNDFINLDDDIIMSDLAFHQSNDQF